MSDGSLSAALGQPVLSIYSDDDEADFACLAAGGLASNVTALCDETVLRYVNGLIEFNPRGRRAHDPPECD